MPRLVSGSWQRTISQLRLATDAHDLKDVILRMQWEGSAEPAVALSLATFFGAALALADYETLPLAAARFGNDVSLEASFPMPYRSHALISLENTGERERAVSVANVDPPLSAAGHFYTSYRHSTGPFGPDDRHIVAALQGPGKYVGTLVSRVGRAPQKNVRPRRFAMPQLRRSHETPRPGHRTQEHRSLPDQARKCGGCVDVNKVGASTSG